MHCNAVGLREARMRLSDQPARCVDRGTTWPAFFQEPLEGRARPSNTAVSLQSLLDAWAQQEGEHALVRVPEVLCLQVNRFNIGSGDSHKSAQPVVPELQILMPKFCHDLQMGDALKQSYVLYCRTAMILHLGPRCASCLSLTVNKHSLRMITGLRHC